MQLASYRSANPNVVSALANAGDHSITSMGAAAEQQLSGVHQGQVMAVFERSFYVQTASGLFCIGLQDIGYGPLNALLSSQYKCLPFSAMAGERVHISNSKITLEGNRVLDATAALAYHCELTIAEPKPQVLQRNREALKTLMGMPSDGFFWLLGVDTSGMRESALQSALRQTTSDTLLHLTHWLRTGFADSNAGLDSAHDASAVLGLVGAGPGLTPAGDDVVAGVMLALLRLQRIDLANQIWQTISPSLTALTNPISAAHLAQAAKGHCGESMNDLLDEIFQDENLEIATLSDALNGMGCTSGWDTLGGITMVIDAWQHSLKNNT